MSKEIYLDHAATTATDPKVLEAMLPYFCENYGNPSSIYKLGRNANAAIDAARKTVANVLQAKHGEIIFTSGGTESVNLALFGFARRNTKRSSRPKGHIITTVIEHSCVLEACKTLEYEGFDVTYLPVDENGIVNRKNVVEAVRDDTILVSIMYANNEIGTIQPIAEIGKALKQINEGRAKNGQQKIAFHSDACQAAGYLNLKVNDLGVDLLTINGSKIYGPKGVGILYIRDGIMLEPLLRGGGQEKGLRGGTENVAGIVGIAKALELVTLNRAVETKRLSALQKYFFDKLSRIKDITINGSLENRLPNNVNISIAKIEGESAVLYLDAKGIYCSSASACSASSHKPSHVIMALGRSAQDAQGTLRFTMGRGTLKKDIDFTVSELKIIIDKLRSISAV